MYSIFKSYLNSNTQLKNSQLFLAISGGVDSMVLSHLLHHFDITHTLLHCNFQLRGAESNEDEQFLKDYAYSNKIELKTIKFDTTDYASKHKKTIQEAARDLRYNWFKTFLKNENDILLTAHHLDDSIESFFINVLRGTGLKGLTGIQTDQNQIIRPLLQFTKDQILEFAKQQNISFREDSSNSSDYYLRNKLRHQFIPELKQLSNNFERKMETLFDDLQQSNNWIEQSINDVQNKLNLNYKIDVDELLRYPTFLWYKIFNQFGISRKQNPELVKLINGHTGAILQVGNFKILKDRSTIIVSNNEIPTEVDLQININDSVIELPNGEIRFEKIPYTKNINFKPNVAFLDFDKLNFPLQIRNWKQGDKIKPFGMNGNKLISDVLTDKKINQFEKEKQLVLVSKSETLWLVDLMISNQFAITNQTKSILKIEHIKY